MCLQCGRYGERGSDGSRQIPVVNGRGGKERKRKRERENRYENEKKNR